MFLAPIGYLNAPRAMGKSLMRDPERAPRVRRAFEEYATGRFTKQQLLKQSRAWGLTNRRGCPLTSQAIGVLLRNQLYAGILIWLCGAGGLPSGTSSSTIMGQNFKPTN